MLRKKTNGVARRPQRTSILSKVGESAVDRRAFLRGSGLAIGGLAAISGDAGQCGGLCDRRHGNNQIRLHPLLGRLYGHRRGAKRCLGRSGTRLGQPLQLGIALRQGRISARARPW